jgi:hypothetical protein
MEIRDYWQFFKLFYRCLLNLHENWTKSDRKLFFVMVFREEYHRDVKVTSYLYCLFLVAADFCGDTIIFFFYF